MFSEKDKQQIQQRGSKLETCAKSNRKFQKRASPTYPLKMPRQ